MWIYWKEQCEYCKNKGKCGYEEKVKKYIEDLSSVEDKGIYGTLNFKCDYNIIDEDLYYKKNPNECQGHCQG